VLRSEVAALRNAGYGGIEIQPLAIGLAPADETSRPAAAWCS
jgi:hypothetical protein